MTRSASLRASLIFVVFAAVFASIGLVSHVPAAEALFLISASLCAVLFLFGINTPSHAPVPVRVRRR
jgi:hypothetical protein